jgi:predicted ATPase/class 3 adenylate cyclase
MAGERRIVTMLFCDIQGSTQAAGELDPEDWTAIMNQAFEHMIQPVYRYEGTVARLMGDAILAFFGAPIAHEDDPQRAILAGLDIVAEFQPYRERVMDEWGVDVNVRAGINTGLVVVGAVGSDLRMEYTALGDAINLAARMEQTADPGTVRVADATYRLVAPAFDFEKLGPITVKGKDEPVQAYRAIGRKTQPGRLRGIAGLRAPLVGRDPEMGMIERVFKDLHGGKGQILSIIGEAGLGKSRLVAEAQRTWRRILGRPEDEPGLPPVWTMSQGISFETSIPYGHWQQHIRQVCGIVDSDAPDQISEKIEGQIILWPEERRDAIRRVYHRILSGRPGADASTEAGSEIVKQEVLALLAEGFRLSASNAAAGKPAWSGTPTSYPPVIAFDDLHWADPASVELLTGLFQLTNEAPMLFMLVFRPERESGAWRAREIATRKFADRYTEINLRPLSRSEGDQLVSHLLKAADLKDDLRAFIQDRSDGNPLFLEELVRTLIDQGHVVPMDGDSGISWRSVGKIDQITIPDSLQTLLMSRIDRLDEEAKQVLQIAAVIGRKFYYRVLKIICETLAPLDQRLQELQRAELIRESSRMPELEYTFRHTLTQETTYKSILRQRRREFHLQVGMALEELFPDRKDEFATLLAQHFDEGRDLEKALRYHRLAADSAFALDAQVEAQRHYERGIELARSLEDTGSLAYLYRRRGRSLELQGDFDAALENYDEMSETAADFDDKALRLGALTSRGTIHSTATEHFNMELADSIAEEALPLALELHDPEAEARIYWNQLNRCRLDNKNSQAVEFGRKALHLAEEHDLPLILAYTKNDLGHVLVNSDVRSALDMFEEAIALWRDLGNRPMLADGLSSYALYSVMIGEFQAALTAGQEARQVSESIQNIWGLAFSTSSLAMAYTEIGQWDRAIEAGRISANTSGQVGYVIGQILANLFLCIAYLKIGAIDLADKVMRRSEDFMQLTSARFMMFTRSFQAIILISKGELDAAAEALGSAEGIEGSNLYGQFLWDITNGDLALARGDYERVLEICAVNGARFERASARPYLAQNLHVEARAHLALGEHDAAAQALGRAIDIVQETGQRPLFVELLKTKAALFGEQGDAEAAGELTDKVQQIVLELSQNIADPAMRGVYLNTVIPEADRG